jgi:hypothetical protein
MPAEWEKMLPKELREYIEAERRLAHAAGYAEAKGELAGATYLATYSVAPTHAPVEQPVRQSGPDQKSGADDLRMARGLAAMHAEDVFREISPRAATGIEVRLAVKEKTGLDLPSTTFYRAIKALAKRGVIEQVGDTSAWRYVKRQEGERGSSNDGPQPPHNGMPPRGNGAMPLRP